MGLIPPADLDALIDFAQALADAARPVTRRYFRAGVAIEDKADTTPVTQADREAETLLRRMIAKRHPDHGLVGEEGGTERGGADFVWVLDPIDGTKRFITGNPLFGTLIALLRDGQPLLGIIDMPILDERWTGAIGRPTQFRTAAGAAPARTRACPGLDKAALYATSPHMFKGADTAPFDRLREAVKLPLYGAECYAYGLLASGHVDLVVEADMAPYDYLALVPVIAGAGGLMTDWQGRPLGLGSGGRVLAAGDRKVHKAALELLNHG